MNIKYVSAPILRTIGIIFTLFVALIWILNDDNGIIFPMDADVRYSTLKLKDTDVHGGVQHGETADSELFQDTSTNNEYYDKYLPLVFVGGCPRSGTTLMRTMLDAHDDIRCGPETRVIPLALKKIESFLENRAQTQRLIDMNLLGNVLEGMARFVLDIIKSNGPHAKYLCNKDPLTCVSQRFIYGMFPNARYVMMVRDPRAVAYSFKTRRITVKGVKTTEYRDSLKFWEQIVTTANKQCKSSDRCIRIRYEDLVLQPVNTTKTIFNFLRIEWSKNVLYHEKFINQSNVPESEPSADQVNKSLYLDALTCWFGKIPTDILKDVGELAPLMKEFDYKPDNYTPKYGEPDDFVLKRGVWAVEDQTKKDRLIHKM